MFHDVLQSRESQFEVRVMPSDMYSKVAIQKDEGGPRRRARDRSKFLGQNQSRSTHSHSHLAVFVVHVLGSLGSRNRHDLSFRMIQALGAVKFD